MSKNVATQTVREAIEAAFLEAFTPDSSLLLIGENVKPDLTDVTLSSLNDCCGEQVINELPLSEELFGGIALGLAQVGYHPVIQLNWSAFTTLLYDQLLRIGSWSTFTRSDKELGVLIRLGHDGYNRYGVGSELSNLLIGQLARIPNIVILTPSSPQMAGGLLRLAFRTEQLIIFLEHKALYDISGPVEENGSPQSFDDGVSVIPGSDITLVSWSYTAVLATQAATKLKEVGISAEVISLHTLVPLREDVIKNSTQKTKRLLIIDEESERGSFGAYIASRILDGSSEHIRIKLLCGKNKPMPNDWHEGQTLVPSKEQIVEAAQALCNTSGRFQLFKRF